MNDMVPCKVAGQGALTQANPQGRIEADQRAALTRIVDGRPNWDGVVLMIGNPNHWVHISAGEVVSFQSTLTGRLAASLGGAGVPDTEAIADSVARPERLAAHLASASLGGDGAAVLGHLIGAELAGARAYWLGQEVVIMGEGDMARAYGAALTDLGAIVTG